MEAEVLIRDWNGNTLLRTEVPGLPYEGFEVVEAHVSDSGTLIVTVNVREEES